jgi:hypothetical protein
LEFVEDVDDDDDEIDARDVVEDTFWGPRIGEA